MTDVSVDTTSALSSAVGNGSLSLFGEFTNIQKFIASDSLAVTPHSTHYRALGFDNNLDDGYIVNKTTKLNDYLLNNSVTVNNLVDLQNLIAADQDRDGQSTYFDDDDALYNVTAVYLFYPNMSSSLPTVSYEYLFSAKVKIAGETEKYVFIPHDNTIPNAQSGSQWTKVVADTIEAELEAQYGVNAFDVRQGSNSNTAFSSSYNAIEGVEWIELSYIDEWQGINAYREDATSSVAAPDDTDYNLISATQIDGNQSTELNKLLKVNNPTDYDATVELITSYDTVYEYASDSGNPIIATAPQSTDYINIGLT
ncbi:hypothetical protein, partial [Vibrio thalassae]|uniref:hypothetical protein n=1 Tax=Vibrio thalassae TaxID=1243014 RepID=UPI00363B6F65